ncbi:MAG: V-type ATP synthase subunit K [Oscillospiraceae bacterium]|nr:V-type ATP synthase subunit K [Oscillospiraceae bacterium]
MEELIIENAPTIGGFFVENAPQILTVLGIFLAIVLAGIGSAKGGAMISKATTALISVQPEKFGQSLVLYMMSASQGLYGFIIGFLIFMNLGENLTIDTALKCFAAGAIMGVAGLVTAIAQSTAATAGVQVLAKKPEHFMKGLLYSAMIETYAIFAFVISILVVPINIGG